MNIVSIADTKIKKGTRVLLRSSLNLPTTEKGEILNHFRLNESIKTIKLLVDIGAKITIISHFGRKGESLEKVADELKKYFDIKFIKQVTGEKVKQERDSLEEGEILLLENTRIDERDIQEDVDYAKELIYNAEIFVYDDFSTGHREHSSTTTIIGEIPTFVGINFMDEINALDHVINNIESPSFAIIAGAKLQTKAVLLKELLLIYDNVFVGGVMLNNILKQKGIEIGASYVEDFIFEEDVLNNKKLITPNDVWVQRGEEVKNVNLNEISKDDIIVDVGVNSICSLKPLLLDQKTIIWNGPLGLYEKGFVNGTLILSKLIGDSKAYKLLGGGDISGLIISEKQESDWSFISTAGGALLQYLSYKTLPVLDKLESQDQDTIENFL